MDCPFVEYDNMTQELATVGKIIFEFYGGCMDGRSVEGGDGTHHSVECLDPVMNYWIDSYFGRLGHDFYIKADGALPHDDLYQVVDRIDAGDDLLIQARYQPNPRD